MARKMTSEQRKARTARRLDTMTDHQRERRSRKSRLFFAKLALKAGEVGDKAEALRLYTAALRKGAVMFTARAVMNATGERLAA